MIKVKPLEWQRGLIGDNTWYARGWAYRIMVDRGNPDLYIVGGMPSTTNPWNTIEEAQAFVLAYHEKRILNAIEEVP